MVLFYSSFFLFISLLSYALLSFHTKKTMQIRKRIHTYIASDSGNLNSDYEEQSFYQRVLDPVWKDIKRKYQKRLSKEKATRLEIRLLQAGQPYGFSPVEFRMLQVALLILFPFLGLGLVMLLRGGFFFVLLTVLFGIGLGTLAPNYYLKAKAQKRSKQAVRELPDTLDLLTISLEGGLGFDSALSKVVSKKQGILSKEFKQCLEEIRLGKTRKEALSALTHRLQSEELKSLIYSIIQAEKLGIGMVSLLRVQTEEIREQRKQKAEEAAMKAPIKMMFPLVLFIFPTLFIILLGPAILQFIEAF